MNHLIVLIVALIFFLISYIGSSFAQVTWTKNSNNPVLSPGEPGEWDDDFQNRRRDELLAEMDLLDLALVQCDEDWTRFATPEYAEEIRTSGLESADSLVGTIHRYENVVAGYYRVLDIYVDPPGGGSGIIP